MIPGIVLAQWEIKRLVCSKVALVLFAATAAACGVLSGKSHGSALLRDGLLMLSILWGWLLLYLRFRSDRASGFVDGLESTPAAGLGIVIAWGVLCICSALFQACVFYATLLIPIP
jgi:hypothetical protein